MTGRLYRTLSLVVALAMIPAFGTVLAADDIGPTPVSAVPLEEKPSDRPFRLTWADGATTFQTDDFSVALSNRIQFRFTEVVPDEKVRLAGTEKAGDGMGSFRIRRAKTSLEGWVWRKELTFELQLGWAGSDSTGGSSSFSGLEDAYLSWDISRKGLFRVTLGQYKVPFGRQEMTSSERLQFVDRSILSGEFTHSRDVGVSIGGGLASSKLTYAVGIFNGNGRNKVTNDNNKYQYDARVVFQPWGDVKYSECDFDSTSRPLVALAAQFEQNDHRGSTNINDLKDTTFGGDLVFKWKGISLFGEYFARQRKPKEGASFDSNGFNLEAGYFILRSRLQVAFRYTAWDPSDQTSSDEQTETGGAVSYFFRKHRLKLVGDVRQIKDRVQDTTTTEVRIQTQFVF